MSDLKPTDMYVRPNSCKYVTGNKTTAKPATTEIPARKGVDVVLDKEGNVTTKAIAAIVGKPATPAQKGKQEMWIWVDSTKLLKEIEARMTASGVVPVAGVALVDKLETSYIYRGFDVSKKIGQCYSAENRQIFQDAFRKVKSKDHFNKSGAAVLKADQLEKNRKKAEAKKKLDEEKAAKKKEAAQKTENQEVKKKKLAGKTKNPTPGK